MFPSFGHRYLASVDIDAATHDADECIVFFSFELADNPTDPDVKVKKGKKGKRKQHALDPLPLKITTTDRRTDTIAVLCACAYACVYLSVMLSEAGSKGSTACKVGECDF